MCFPDLELALLQGDGDTDLENDGVLQSPNRSSGDLHSGFHLGFLGTRETGPLRAPLGDPGRGAVQAHAGGRCTAQPKPGFRSPGLRLGVALVTTTSGPDRKPGRSLFRTRSGAGERRAGLSGGPRRVFPRGRATPEDSWRSRCAAWPWAGAMEAFTRFTNQTQGRDRLFR